MTAIYERPPTTQESALREIRRMILAGEFAPGEPIRQEAVADRLSVSRVPIREALKSLLTEGLVSYEAHRGYSVTELSADDFAEVYRLRDLLEAEAIHTALDGIDRTTSDALATEMERWHAEIVSAAGDIPTITEANRRLHFTIFDAADRPRLARLLHQLWDATDVYRAVYFSGADNRDRVHREHLALIDAVRDADAKAAIEISAQHRETSLRTVVALVNGATTSR